MVEQGTTGDFYGTRAFTTFAVPTGTPQDIVERLSVTFMQAGSDARVKQVLSNFLLSQPTDLKATQRIFSHDSQVMLAILRGRGVKPSE